MDDDHLKILALISIAAGLAVLFFFMLDYTPKNAIFISGEDDNIYINGSLIGLNYDNKSGNSYMDLFACRQISAQYPGYVSKGIGDRIYLTGTIYNDRIIANSIK